MSTNLKQNVLFEPAKTLDDKIQTIGRIFYFFTPCYFIFFILFLVVKIMKIKLNKKQYEPFEHSTHQSMVTKNDPSIENDLFIMDILTILYQLFWLILIIFTFGTTLFNDHLDMEATVFVTEKSTILLIVYGLVEVMDRSSVELVNPIENLKKKNVYDKIRFYLYYITVGIILAACITSYIKLVLQYNTLKQTKHNIMNVWKITVQPTYEHFEKDPSYSGYKRALRSLEQNCTMCTDNFEPNQKKFGLLVRCYGESNPKSEETPKLCSYPQLYCQDCVDETITFMNEKLEKINMPISHRGQLYPILGVGHCSTDPDKYCFKSGFVALQNEKIQEQQQEDDETQPLLHRHFKTQ